ncbi:hypothetical protein E4U54_005912 [Claviceps lovelessii]|nr:hypothetical protein E4U54_005912 [Claviceps lovelessii]
MRDPGGSDQGDRDRVGRGPSYMDRPRSPPPRSAQRSPSSSIASRHRHSRSDHDSSKHERRRSRERSRERSKKYSHDHSAGQHGPVEDLIPRFRAKKAREHDLDKEAHRSRSQVEVVRSTRLVGKDQRDRMILLDGLGSILPMASPGGTVAESRHKIATTATITDDTDQLLHAATPTPADLPHPREIPSQGAKGSRSPGHHQDTRLIRDPSCPKPVDGNALEIAERLRKVLLQLRNAEEPLPTHMAPRVALKTPRGLRLPVRRTWKPDRTDQITHDLRGHIGTPDAGKTRLSHIIRPVRTWIAT